MSLNLPAMSLPIFSGRKNCLQNVRDIPDACAILESLQYPSFARANTVSESHYARTMPSGVRFPPCSLLLFTECS